MVLLIPVSRFVPLHSRMKFTPCHLNGDVTEGERPVSSLPLRKISITFSCEAPRARTGAHVDAPYAGAARAEHLYYVADN